MAAEVTYRLPGGARVRSGTQRAYVLISLWQDPDTHKDYVRIERRSDSRESLRDVRRRRVFMGARWFIGTQAGAGLEEIG